MEDLISDEEKKAIKKLKQMEKFYNEFSNSDVEISMTLNEKDIRIIIQILNLIQKLQEENDEADKIIDDSIEEQKEREKYTHSLEEKLEKQGKVIDEMAEKIYKLKIKLEINDLLEDCFIPRGFSDIDNCVKTDCKDCIKQYFYRKAENENENND